MDYSDVDASIACLPKGRTLFHYFPDRYAAYLLSRLVGEDMAIAGIRKTRFAKLLHRPVIKEVVARCGDGRLRAADLAATWPDDPQTYLLTLGHWGPSSPRHWTHGYHQTSRRGANLVLHLNFSARHNEPYRNLIRPGMMRPFQHGDHPNAPNPAHTLAWARLDIEYDTGEALIEEIQSDWIKLAAYLADHLDTVCVDAEGADAMSQVGFRGVDIDPKAFRTYLDDVLSVHMKMWQEAVLTAAIWFLLEEIGIDQIYYHQFDCGRWLKKIEGATPPRSLYTRLPAKFCFAETDQAPSFLSRHPTKVLRMLRKDGLLRFWRLEF